MKKIIKLTESDLQNIVKKVLKEQGSMFGTAGTNIPGYRKDDVRNIPNQKEKQVRVFRDINPKKLKFGDGGIKNPNQVEDVKKLQSELIGLGLLKIDGSQKPTGYFGKLTKDALDKYYFRNKRNVPTIEKDESDSVLSKNISQEFIKKFDINKLSSTDSTPVCAAGQEHCAKFVNEFSDKLGWVGDAWIAHDNNSLGEKIWSSYNSLKTEDINKIIDLYKKIDSYGGGKENGKYMNEIKLLQQKLIPKIIPVELNVDDVVGIYYPDSSHHEQAFYQAGKEYFTKDKNGQIKPKPELLSGKGFGINTHVGIVGAMKDGVPLVFHNIRGQVYSDPFNKLRGGGKIAWVRRGKSWFDRFRGLDTP